MCRKTLHARTCFKCTETMVRLAGINLVNFCRQLTDASLNAR